MIDSVVEPEAPAVERLRRAAALQAAAEAAQGQALLDLAAEVEWDENAEFDLVGTRPIRIGADGTRLVDEHLPLEVAAALGMSVTAAIWLIRPATSYLAGRLDTAVARDFDDLLDRLADELVARGESGDRDRLPTAPAVPEVATSTTRLGSSKGCADRPVPRTSGH